MALGQHPKQSAPLLAAGVPSKVMNAHRTRPSTPSMVFIHLSLLSRILCRDGGVVHLHQRRGTLSVVCAESCSGLCLFLRVGLVAQLLDSGTWSVAISSHRRAGFNGSSPSLVHLPLVVCFEVGLALKPLCAFFAVPVAEAWQILGGLCVLELGEMLFVAQVGVDLVEIARVAARLLLGLFSPYGRHGGGGVGSGGGVSFWQGGRGFGSQSVGLAHTWALGTGQALVGRHLWAGRQSGRVWNVRWPADGTEFFGG